MFFSFTQLQVGGMEANLSPLEIALAGFEPLEVTNETQCNMKDGRRWPSADLIKLTPPWNQRKRMELFLFSLLLLPGQLPTKVRWGGVVSWTRNQAWEASRWFSLELTSSR